MPSGIIRHRSLHLEDPETESEEKGEEGNV